MAVAPKGKFRVIESDTFESPPTDVLVGDFNTEKEAVTKAQSIKTGMSTVFVYNDAGECLYHHFNPAEVPPRPDKKNAGSG